MAAVASTAALSPNADHVSSRTARCWLTRTRKPLVTQTGVMSWSTSIRPPSLSTSFQEPRALISRSSATDDLSRMGKGPDAGKFRFGMVIRRHVPGAS